MFVGIRHDVFSRGEHPISESNGCTDGCVTQPLRLSAPYELGVICCLLDSLEAIDADRIAALVKYVETHTDLLILALLEEDSVDCPSGTAECLQSNIYRNHHELSFSCLPVVLPSIGENS